MYKLLIVLMFLIYNLSFSFDYQIQTHAKRTIVKTIPISKTEKYISFTLEGTWTDNLGNYGMMEQSSFVMLNNDNVIELDGYGKTIYQNNQETYFRGYRNRQEKDAGVGETEIPTEECEPNTPGNRGILGAGCIDATDFLRSSLLIGLQEKENIGVNPIKLGIIAATDNHSATPGAVKESDWNGSVSGEDTPLGRLGFGQLGLPLTTAIASQY